MKHCKKHKTDHSKLKCPQCNSEAVQRRRDNVKLQAIAYKGGKCSVCGYDRCIAALEFHHIDPKTKSFGIAQQGQTRSWDRVQEELDKCILVCANCHREIEHCIPR